MEREELLSRSIMTALENVFGPRWFGPEHAVLAEPEWSDKDVEKDQWVEPPDTTLSAIALELNISRERARQYVEQILGKVRRGFEALWSDARKARHLAAHTGLEFREALLLVEAREDVRLWEELERIRCEVQARRAAVQVRRAWERRKERFRRLAAVTGWGHRQIGVFADGGATDAQIVELATIYPALPLGEEEIIRALRRFSMAGLLEMARSS